ncbi:hypothetical protein FQA39_LY14208 [Lamprigera yunnana]|nr:hypothetical protein FQA39_LY14208 [Lamprigera yunnana]
MEIASFYDVYTSSVSQNENKMAQRQRIGIFEEDKVLLSWIIGEEVHIGGSVKLDFWNYYWLMLRIIIRVLHPTTSAGGA